MCIITYKLSPAALNFVTGFEAISKVTIDKNENTVEIVVDGNQIKDVPEANALEFAEIK